MMYCSLLLILVPLVTCHYHDDYRQVRDSHDYNDNGYYGDNMGHGDGVDYQVEGYDTSYDNTVYKRNMLPNSQKRLQQIQSVAQPPLRRPLWMMLLLHKLAEQTLSPSKPVETTVNLKVSGNIELVKSFKDMEFLPGDRLMHGQPHPGHWWMKKQFRKKKWLKHVAEFHKHLHDLEKKHQEEDDEEDEDEDNDDFVNDEDSKLHSRLNCPIWITTQFLKLCKCPKINGKVESVLGHPLKEFPKDPMQLFNNTPGMKELDKGDVKGLLTMVSGMKPSERRELFFAGMIKSMCADAKSYIKRVEVFEKSVRARERVLLATSSRKASGDIPARPYGTVSPDSTEKPSLM